MPGVPKDHPRYGAVLDYGPGYGLACAGCGYDAHEGACRTYHCQDCGAECVESGCSEHPRARVRVETTLRSAGGA